MKCDACGAPVENGKCTYCGKVFTQQPTYQQPPTPQYGPVHTNNYAPAQPPYTPPRPQANPNPPKPKTNFWARTGTVIFMLLFFTPIGIGLMWGYKKFNLVARIIITVLFGIPFLGTFIIAVMPESTTTTAQILTLFALLA